MLVCAQTNAGKDRICEVFHEDDSATATATASQTAADNDDDNNSKSRNTDDNLSVAGISFPYNTTYFLFQNVKYEFDCEKNTFVPVSYPTASTLSNFCSHTGHRTSQSVESALKKWGRNEFEIPMPEFVDLYLVSV